MEVAKSKAAETEEIETKEIQMEVVKLRSLPEKFRPQASGAPTVEEMPRPIADLAREATSDLTGPERRAFLRRLREEHPEIFSGKASGENQDPSETLSEDFPDEKWRGLLTDQLKKQANRFMAAAASL